MSTLDKVAVARDQLIDARADMKDVDAQVAQKRAEWDAANAELLQRQATVRAEMQQAESELREAIRQAFLETGSKHPAPGCGVRINTRLKYSCSASDGIGD